MKIEAAWVISDLARECLERCELFRDLNRRQLMEIAALVEEHTLVPDELLLREGDAARYLYVIVEGRAVAQLERYRGWLSLGMVGPADAAGWSSLTGAKAYPTSVKALTPMRVARLEAKGLTLLMNIDPAIGYPFLPEPVLSRPKERGSGEWSKGFFSTLLIPFFGFIEALCWGGQRRRAPSGGV